MPGERFPSGVRPGRRRAQGVDLDSIGPYVPGDDLRWMDWRATARTGRAQMKRFIAESHLARILIVDLRSHMFFATKDRPMAKTAALVAAQMSWEAVTLHEPLGLIIVPEDEFLRPRRGRVQALRVLERLVDSYRRCKEDRKDATNVALAAALDTAGNLLSRGDEICMLSDFGGPLEAMTDVARGIAGARSLRAILIEDAIFSHAPPKGRYPLQASDDSNPQVAEISAAMAARHTAKAAAVRGKLRRELLQAGWRTCEVAGIGRLVAGGAA